MKSFIRCLRYKDKGFTLIELLIVIAILGLLAAVIIPNVQTFLGSGKIGAARAELKNLQVAVDGMMADAEAKQLTNEVNAWWGEPGAVLIIVDATIYDAGDYVRRSPTDGTFKVYTDGIVECVAYPGLDADGIVKVNNP